VVSEQLNDARVLLAEHQAAATTAGEAVVAAEVQLAALDGQIRRLARSAYTGSGMSQLDLLLTSDSSDELVSSLSTLEAIAEHTDEVLTEVEQASEEAAGSRE
ncbi:hypothetical protein, partial [Enterococcus faecalis]